MQELIALMVVMEQAIVMSVCLIRIDVMVLRSKTANLQAVVINGLHLKLVQKAVLTIIVVVDWEILNIITAQILARVHTFILVIMVSGQG